MSSKQQPALLPELEDEETASPAYVAFPSVWTGEDSDLLERMLNFYPHNKPKRILDATVNGVGSGAAANVKLLGWT